MKIAYLTHTLNPKTGAGIFSARLIDGVKKLVPGVQISILTSEDLLAGKWKIFRNIFAIRKIFESVDVIHALDGFPYGIIATVLGWGLNKPIIITAIGTGAIQKLPHPLWGRLLAWAYRKATVVTAPSAYVAGEIHLFLPEIPVLVVHHGVDAEKWAKGEACLPEGVQVPFILSVGAIKRRKGYHVSIPVIARVLAERPALQYVIVGNLKQSPEYAGELQGLVAKAGIAGERVLFVSGISGPELRGLYQKAELFVLMPQNEAGDVEGFGLVFLEAAAAGLPIVASRGTAAEDAVAEGKNALLVDAKDEQGLYRAVKGLLDDNARRALFQKASREHAQAFAWDNKISQYVEQYKKFQS